ncbi:nicotinate phosphoribosyltransferase [Gynurincola endophyticus]|uniref:nicotinate phosphoribosyltransferase n=1 Tax=Gynurincola endophyticus TaxID=2479004 RepID=UPI000F8E504B|nr:nicotinate phosphoribosyltransferase [Gynurincola endophyticus]
MTSDNIILLADGYKYAHHKLYYPGTNKIYSYLESRGGVFPATVFFGLQYYLKKYLSGQVITEDKINAAEKVLTEVFQRQDVFDRTIFEYILHQHGGRLPVKINAVPEGSVVENSNVLMTIENTDPQCYWLTNFLETLLVQIWYPITVATLSHHIRLIVEEYYQETASAGSFTGIPYVLNDFGFRGVSSVESAGLGDMSHLLNFVGSDTIVGSVFAQQYYQAASIIGKSIPATEHSICTLLGEEGELAVFEHVLRTYPTGTVACVSDSFDIFRACADYWGTALKELILSREGTLVIRPDSGDPTFTLLRVFDILFEKFGFTFNEKGYKVLPKQIRVIQGDGVNLDSIRQIYACLKLNGISAENLVLGMGGALLQKPDRDVNQFALKCSYAEINGAPIDVQKNPLELNKYGVLQRSFKKSKKGQLKLVKEEGAYKTYRIEENDAKDLMVPVFENGTILKEYTFEEIISRIYQ